MTVKWTVTYKCRLCGQQFGDGGTDGDNTASNITVSVITDRQFHEGNPVSRISRHYCDNGDIGFGDIVGLVKLDDE